jgi:uncharacterized Zn finger protein
MSYLIFAWAPTGYELREQEGEPPKVGDVVEVDGRRVAITKIGVSPLPGDSRPCAYSMGS